MYYNNKQTGFTLVEIAIVLVIIGLLLGGILKGQELINSARVRNLADQNSGIQAAYFGFIDRYRQVPGDMDGTAACEAIGLSNFAGAPANCAAVVGGDAGGSLADQTLAATHLGEGSALWAHLSAAGFIQGAYEGGATTAATYVNTTAITTPVNAFNGRVMLTRTNQFVGSASARLAFVFGSQIPVSIMRELDVKVDDSFPDSGVLRHTTSTTAGDVVESTAACVTGSIWDIEADEQNCNSVYIY